jgi:hypothetical protein
MYKIYKNEDFEYGMIWNPHGMVWNVYGIHMEQSTWIPWTVSMDSIWNGTS